MTTPVVVSRIQNRRGTQAQFNALYPLGYTGIGGFGSIPGYNLTNYPSILMPGEIALCTDTRRIFIGNTNGEYIEVGVGGGGGGNPGEFTPISVQLAPAAVFTLIPSLTYMPTPFMTLLYDITDSANPDWNTVGTTFSRNGKLEITAVAPFAPVPPVPPFPPLTPVTLTDTGTEINKVLPNSITFMAQYNIGATAIEILYRHNFAGPLTFSTSSIYWLPF